MTKIEIVIPKLGESVIEATITRWLKNEGDSINEEDPVVEVATDKVDSDIPSPVSGILIKKLFNEGDIVPVGQAFAIIESEKTTNSSIPASDEPSGSSQIPISPSDISRISENIPEQTVETVGDSKESRFYSPLVLNIAKQENIPVRVLDTIPGSGKDNRLTKVDLMTYILNRTKSVSPSPEPEKPTSISGENEIIEMNRIRQLIAKHMIKSVQTSPHVTSFLEVDMTRIVQWREKSKEDYLIKYNQKLTYTPVFIEAIAAAIKDFPMINVSVDGTKIVLHKSINIGMAVSLPDFNLIVPVIKNVGQKSFHEIVRDVNDLADRARKSKLLPDEISGGTISLTNLGSFGTLAGTPIINQPQTAIVAVGLIKKRPVVIDSPTGDMIAIRSMMILSITYDHRVIDGALAGQFLNRMQNYYENFNHP